MNVGNSRKDPRSGKILVDLINVNDTEIMWLHEALHNYAYDKDDPKQSAAHDSIQAAVKEAFKVVRP